MEKMLINATQAEEIRVALIRDQYLYDLDIEGPSEVKKKGNIYKARVTRREPSLDAVFVEYGSKRQGFLPLKEIAPNYLSSHPDTWGENRPTVASLIKEGQELLIQVDKEERGTKGAALTTFITLAGCYLVLMPNSPNSGGISRRIEGDDRDELKDILSKLQLTEDMGVIIRTAGVGKNLDELQADLDMLCNQWQAINNAYQSLQAPSLIHQEGDVIIRSIRDNLRKSINEIIIDDHVSYVKAKQYIEQVKPDFLPNLKLYKSNVPLFNYYQIESQIETAYQREVLLPSGGALVIDRTEALVSIDINSAKSTSGGDIETTAFTTNLEAADEIARQLRLRDLGGLVVIDFIDMSTSKNQREVENRLKEALKTDRARIQLGRISRFGLLEMSRQRLRLSLGEAAQKVCPRCEGRGTVRNIQSHSLTIVRLIEEEALKNKISEIHVQLPSDMATFLMNEKREHLIHIEKRHQVQILIICNPHLQSPHYSINSIHIDNVSKNKQASYSLVEAPEIEPIRAKKNQSSQAAVDTSTTFNKADGIESSGFFQRLWNTLFVKNSLNHKNAEDTNKTSSQKKQSTYHKKGTSNRSNHNRNTANNGSGTGTRNPRGRSQNNIKRDLNANTTRRRTNPQNKNAQKTNQTRASNQTAAANANNHQNNTKRKTQDTKQSS